MDLSNYNAQMMRIIDKYNHVKLANKKIITILLTIFFAVFLVMLTYWIKVLKISLIGYILLASTLGLLFIAIIIILVFGYISTQNIIKKDIHNLLIEILNYETTYQIKCVKDIRDLKQKILSTRFIHKWDTIQVINSFEFVINDIGGIYARVNISRSNGKSSITVINGNVIILNILNQENLQIRNDYFSSTLLKKDKELSSKDLKVYFPKEFLDKNIISKAVYDQCHLFKKSFLNERFGIDYNLKKISVFNNILFNIKSPRELSRESFQMFIDMYLSIIKQIDETIKCFTE